MTILQLWSVYNAHHVLDCFPITRVKTHRKWQARLSFVVLSLVFQHAQRLSAMLEKQPMPFKGYVESHSCKANFYTNGGRFNIRRPSSLFLIMHQHLNI